MSKIDWTKPVETTDGDRVSIHTWKTGAVPLWVLVHPESGGWGRLYLLHADGDRSVPSGLPDVRFRNVEPEKPSYSFWGVLDEADKALGRPFEPTVGAYLREFGTRGFTGIAPGPDALAQANERADKNAAALDAAHREIDSLKAQLAELEEINRDQLGAIRRYRASLHAAAVRAGHFSRSLKENL